MPTRISNGNGNWSATTGCAPGAVWQDRRGSPLRPRASFWCRRIRHRRIQPLAVGADAAAHRVVELLVGPCADTGFAVGRDVRRDDVPNGVSIGASAGETACPAGLVWQAAQSPTSSDNGRARSGEISADRACAALTCAPVSRNRAPRRTTGAWRWRRDYAWTSGPGFLRYCSRIASADQNASAATVPVGL